MPRQINMPFERAKMAAQAVLPHVSSDDVTPVLTVAVVRDDRLVATDRYSVGVFTLQEPKPKEFEKWSKDQRDGWTEHRTVSLEGTLEEGDPTWAEDFMIPRAALLRISTLSKQMTMHGLLMGTRIVIREEFGEWRVSRTRTTENKVHDRRIIVEVVDAAGLVEWSQRFAVTDGRFPPVGKLLDEWKPAQSGEQVAFGLMGSNLAKIIRFAGKHTPFLITAGEPTRNINGEAIKNAPMMVEVGEDFRALIQPTIWLR